MSDAYADLITTSDFNELKGIVRSLAIAQRELAEVQKRTELKIEELTDALHALVQAHKVLVQDHKVLVRERKETRRQLGRLSTTVGYRLENLAYHSLPELG